MSESIKRGKFTYRMVGGSYVRIPPEDPPRTYQMGARGEFVRQPVISTVGSGASRRIYAPPVALRKLIPGELLISPPEEEILLPPLPRKKKVAKKEVPRVIRGVSLAGEESDTEYEYKEPRKRKPVTSNVVVSKKSKSVQTTTKMADNDPYVGVYERVSSTGTIFKVYRYFKKNDTTGKNISREQAAVYKGKGIPFIDKDSRVRQPGVAGATIGGSRRRQRIEDVADVLKYDTALSRRTNKVGRPDARLIPSTHIKYVARAYNISPADVSGIISDMDRLAIAELEARKSDKKYKRVVYSESAPRAPSKTTLSKARRAELIELLG